MWIFTNNTLCILPIVFADVDYPLYHTFQLHRRAFKNSINSTKVGKFLSTACLAHIVVPTRGQFLIKKA